MSDSDDEEGGAAEVAGPDVEAVAVDNAAFAQHGVPAAGEAVVEEEPEQHRYPARGQAAASVTFPGLGTIAFYNDRQAFQASCFCRAHAGRCAKTRTANAKANKPQQGRPLGFLAAWLIEGPRFHNTSEHMSWDPRSEECPSVETRLVCRALARVEHPGFEELEAYERALAPGEQEEPAECP